MPPSEIKRFEILGKGVPGMIGVQFWSELWTKTDSDCWDRRSAFMPGSLCNSPSLMSGATPMLSRLRALMCRQKGLVLWFSNEALRMLLISARCLLTADLILR